jgi:hypothetical protein
MFLYSFIVKPQCCDGGLKVLKILRIWKKKFCESHLLNVKYFFSRHYEGKDGDIEYENIKKKTGTSKRQHQKNGDIENGNIEFKIQKVNIEKNTSIPVKFLGTGLGTIIIPQYWS